MVRRVFNINDYIGQVFGELTVLGQAYKETDYATLALCLCSCNREYVVRLAHLIDGKTTCCATCSRNKLFASEYIGKTFNSWTVLKEVPNLKTKSVKVLCRCVCGVEEEKILGIILRGASKQCKTCFINRANPEQYLNTSFGCYTIVNILPKDGKDTKVLCRCVCGAFSTHRLTHVLTSNNQTNCKYCVAIYKDYGRIKGTNFNKLHKGALKRNLAFDISQEYIDNLFTLQAGKCAISGLTLSFEKK